MGKEKFTVPAGSEFVDVKIPFNTFSDKWSSATGEHTAECADDSSVCLTSNKLSKIKRVEFWGEGANGKLHLEVQSVSAESASGERLVEKTFISPNPVNRMPLPSTAAQQLTNQHLVSLRF